MKTFAIVNVRMPPELAAWLKQSAQAEYRSVNQQVIWILEQHQRAPETMARLPAQTGSSAALAAT